MILYVMFSSRCPANLIICQKRGRQRRGVMRHARRVIESPSPEGEGNLQESLEKEDDGLDDVTPKPPRKRVIGTKEHIPKAVTGTREVRIMIRSCVTFMLMRRKHSDRCCRTSRSLQCLCRIKARQMTLTTTNCLLLAQAVMMKTRTQRWVSKARTRTRCLSSVRLRNPLVKCFILKFHTALSESDASGSDYSATVNEQKRRLQRKHGRSGDITSDDETLDEDEEEPVSRKADKGKGRARSSVIDVERSDSAAMHTQKKPGPFSSVAKERIAAFAENVREAADQLAREFGKTRHDVLVQAGFGSVKSTRALNSMNVYRKWFSAHYPKADAGACSAICLLFGSLTGTLR